MLIVIQKRTLILTGTIVCCLLGFLSFVWIHRAVSSVPVFSAGDEGFVTVIIDAGHGGEVGTHENTPPGQELLCDAAGDAQRRRQPAGEVAAAGSVLKTAVFDLGSVVGVAGAGTIL